MRFVTTALSLGLALGLSAPLPVAPARAQGTDATPAAPLPSPPSATAPAPAPSAVPPPAPLPGAPATLATDLRARFVAQEPSDIVTSTLVGLSIRNGADETIGQVADVVFDGSRTIKAFIVSVGGFLGIGAKYVAIDPSALQLTRVDDRTLKAVIETNRDQLRAAPEYRYLTDAKSGEAKPGDAKPADAKPADAQPRP